MVNKVTIKRKNTILLLNYIINYYNYNYKTTTKWKYYYIIMRNKMIKENKKRIDNVVWFWSKKRKIRNKKTIFRFVKKYT